jgi:hypothetical protein
MVGWNTPLWRRSTVTNEDFLRRGSYFSVTANMDKVIPVVCRHIVTDEIYTVTVTSTRLRESWVNINLTRSKFRHRWAREDTSNIWVLSHAMPDVRVKHSRPKENPVITWTCLMWDSEETIVILRILCFRLPNLPEVADAGRSPSLLPRCRKHREQNCCQDRDYRDHYQQFNQSEADTKTNLKVASPNCPNSILSQHLTSLLFSPLLGLEIFVP